MYRVRQIIFFLTLAISGLAPFMQRSAMADGINGFVELNYNDTQTTTKDASGVSRDLTSNNFFERYNLTLERMIYPYLKLRAGGLFEKSVTDTTIDDQENRLTLTRLSPSVDLTLNNPFLTAGIGYNKIEQKEDTRGVPSRTLIRDTYNALFGLRPEGLPTLDTMFLRTETYDRTRALQDSENTYFLLGSRYRPVKALDLQYQFTSNDAKNLITDVDVSVVTNSGTATYTDRFFNNRVSVYSRYNISSQETTITGPGTGTVNLQHFPFFGLSVITPAVGTPVLGALDLNAAVIDGNLSASSGINIGQLLSISGDTLLRNVGVDFVNPTSVDTLFVWVDRVIPATVATTFVWDIYQSPDNLNWTLVQTVSGAPFGVFENRFELNFAKTTTRYMKVVTRPLAAAVVVPPGFDLSNILVTELQAFESVPAQGVEKTRRTTQIFDLNARTRLLENPSLYYDFFYWYTRTNPDGMARFILSNGLTASHAFSRIFTGSSRIAREDSEEQTGKRVAYVYSASVTAIPLPPLMHSLILSGRSETIAGRSSHNESLFFNNSAGLYRGVDVNLSIGVSSAVSEIRQKTDNTILNAGVSLMPHPAMTLTLNYAGNDIKQSGGGKKDFSTSTNRTDITVAYTPWSTVYLFLSYGAVSEKDRPTNTLTNYSITWSPLPGGTLQFNFAYYEKLTSADNGKETIISPSVRWNIIPRTVLDLSYLILKSENVSQTIDAKSMNVNLKMYF